MYQMLLFTTLFQQGGGGSNFEPGKALGSLLCLIILAGFLGAPIANTAKKKGRRYWPWFFFGVFLFVPALIAVLVVKPVNKAEVSVVTPTRKESPAPSPQAKILCPNCQAENTIGSKFCGNCGKPLPVVVITQVVEAAPKDVPVAGVPAPEQAKTDWARELKAIGFAVLVFLLITLSAYGVYCILFVTK